MTDLDVVPPREGQEFGEVDCVSSIEPDEFDARFEDLMAQAIRGREGGERVAVRVIGDEMLIPVTASIGDKRVSALLVHSVLPDGEIDRRVEFLQGKDFSLAISLTKDGTLLTRRDRTDQIVEDEGGVRGQRNLKPGFRATSNLNKWMFESTVRTARPSNRFRRPGVAVVAATQSDEGAT